METVEIYGFAFGGRAVGRRENGKVCFVRGAVPGETVGVAITSEKKSYSEGILLEIRKASPLRIPVSCPNPCPGCSYAHVPYETELEWKQNQLESFLVRNRLTEKERIAAPTGASKRTSWRNKVKLSVEHSAGGDCTAGYRGEDNLSLIPVAECPLAVPEIQAALREEHWKSIPGPDDASITFRFTETDGVRCFTDRTGNPSHLLSETLGAHGTFLVPETSFFQINSGMSGILADRVVSCVKRCEPKLFLELYSGSGCFSVLAADAVPGLRACGIEIDPRAVETARRNAEAHHVGDRCRFLAADAGKGMKQLFPKRLGAGSMILVDPPRTGMDRRTLELIGRSGAEFLIYVSCSPDTLARDLRILLDSGFRVEESGLIDMFPSTAHFESVTLLKSI